MRVERLNRIAEIVGAKRYLEVGVFEGHTFRALDFDLMVGVDPSFAFDVTPFASTKRVFCHQTSDAFFETSDHAPFDLIYLDGLHTFQQTLRDFMWSMKFAHARTVWLLDDTVPNDPFSALPDQARCYRIRHSLGNPDWSWMGDVFKVGYFIRDFMPQFNLRTFEGHGQTVVWRGTQRAFTPTVGEVGRIAAMDYMDMIETYRDALCVSSDEEIYARLAADLGSR